MQKQFDYSRFFSWGARGAIAISDQMIFSGSNFLMNILLARYLNAADYGAFSVAFSIYLLFSGPYNALILEPMSVLGPSTYSENLKAYLGMQFRFHFWLTITMSALMALFGAGLIAMGNFGPLAEALLIIGSNFPLLLLIWLARRVFYVCQRPVLAMWSSALYSIFMLFGLWLSFKLSMLTPFVSLFIMGGASFAGSIPAFVWVREGGGKFSLRDLLKSHWNFGKWILAASIFSGAGGQMYVFVTAGMLGLAAAGALRAMSNFFLPMAQAITAIALLGISTLSIDYGRRDLKSMQVKGMFLTVSLTGMAVFYEFVLWVGAAPLEQWLYGGKYAEYRWLISILGLIPIFMALTTGLSLVLRAIQKPESYFIVSFATTVASILFGIILTEKWHLGGAAISMAATYFVGFLVTLWLYRLWFSQKYQEAEG